MAASLSVDLRWRVVRAINEEGLSIRAAGRRFCIGESTAGRWHRLWRTSGDIVPGRRGNPGGSRLDAHAVFLLGLVEAGARTSRWQRWLNGFGQNVARRLIRPRSITG